MNPATIRQRHHILLLHIKLMMERLVDEESKSKFAGKIFLSVLRPGTISKAWILPPGTIQSLMPDSHSDLFVNPDWEPWLTKQNGKICTAAEAATKLAEDFLDAVSKSKPEIMEGVRVPVLRLDKMELQMVGKSQEGEDKWELVTDVCGVSTTRAQEIRLQLKSDACYVTLDVS